jgi:tetraacyldisaccharide 4'-kinase
MIYGAITKARNALYEVGFFKSFSLGVPTVSVGNITVGGTGKTPLVAFIAEILAAKGEKVCVLSRGYGRDNPQKRVLVSDGKNILAEAKTAGDEPFELAQKLLGKAIIVADANRVSAGSWAQKKFGISVFVLDDAFQHLRVRRDVNVVTIDATNPFGNEKLLPMGILREPLENLKRADAVVITRANLSENVAGLKVRISKYNANCPIFVTKNKSSGFVDLKIFASRAQDETIYESQITNQEKTPANDHQLQTTNHYFAFCALGNPKNFFEQLRQENFNITSTEEFPDHYFYTQKDITKLEAVAREAYAEILLTTAKDAVKLNGLKFDLPCFVVESEMVFDDENDFRNWLTLKIDASK